MTHLVANTICQQTASGRDGALSAKADKRSLSPPLFSEDDPRGPLFLSYNAGSISDQTATLTVSSNKFMILTPCKKLPQEIVQL